MDDDEQKWPEQEAAQAKPDNAQRPWQACTHWYLAWSRSWTNGPRAEGVTMELSVLECFIALLNMSDEALDLFLNLYKKEMVELPNAVVAWQAIEAMAAD